MLGLPDLPAVSSSQPPLSVARANARQLHRVSRRTDIDDPPRSSTTLEASHANENLAHPMSVTSGISVMLSCEIMDRDRSKIDADAPKARRYQNPFELFLRDLERGSQPHLRVAARVGCPIDTANKWLLSQNLPSHRWLPHLLAAYGVDVVQALGLCRGRT